MYNSLYEVSRDEYVGFVHQIKPECKDIETEFINDYTIIKTVSKKTGIHFCSRIIPDDGNGKEHYFVFNMPEDDERQPGKPVRKITLETKEEVQSFLDVLSKVMKENKK